MMRNYYTYTVNTVILRKLPVVEFTLTPVVLGLRV